MAIETGIYHHYKGNEYRVYGIANHSETGDLLVVYRPLYGEGALWVRPLEMWQEMVQFEGQMRPRFKYLRKE